MAQEIERENPSTDREHRRRGGAFDITARILRNVFEILFANGFIIRNRLGRNIDPAKKLETGLVNVGHMVEMYYPEKSRRVRQRPGINALMVGRAGDGGNRNTQLIELSARRSSEIGSAEGNTNGWVKLRVTRDDEDPPVDRAGISVFDVGGVIVEWDGVAVHLASTGPQGGIVLSHINSRDENPAASGKPRLLIDRDGIQLLGIPTSNPGGSGIVWKNGTTLSIT